MEKFINRKTHLEGISVAQAWDMSIYERMIAQAWTEFVRSLSAQAILSVL